MKFLFAAASLALGLALASPLPALAQDPAQSRQQIEAIVETFRTAIIKKDQATFMGLFLRDDITWAGVYTDGSVDRFHASRKESGKPRPPKYFTSSPRKFIEGIVKAPAPREETFANVRIDTDGDVGQVWFDYAFLDNGKRQNWGKESWQMVRTDSGWKIAAVVWSMEDELIPPAPKKN